MHRCLLLLRLGRGSGWPLRLRMLDSELGGRGGDRLGSGMRRGLLLLLLWLGLGIGFLGHSCSVSFQHRVKVETLLGNVVNMGGQVDQTAYGAVHVACLATWASGGYPGMVLLLIKILNQTS
jgi:hypothetical protein